MPTTPRRPLLQLLLTVLIALGALVASFAVLTPSADAMSMHRRMHVLHVAASKKGAPYRYGASGPGAFDCSGYTRWVFAHLGKRLPHNAAAQSRSVRHVAARHRQRGDLVFFHSGGHVYHVGIYAGNDTIWHAPRPGQRVQHVHLWTHAVSYGRVG